MKPLSAGLNTGILGLGQHHHKISDRESTIMPIMPKISVLARFGPQARVSSRPNIEIIQELKFFQKALICQVWITGTLFFCVKRCIF
jgi:hypothetical protein